MAEEKILHGNQAKIDVKKKPVGLNITNSVTAAGSQKPGHLNDELAAHAREFEEENKK